MFYWFEWHISLSGFQGSIRHFMLRGYDYWAECSYFNNYYQIIFFWLKHNPQFEINPSYIVPLDMKVCICHFVKWQIHPFISKGTTYRLCTQHTSLIKGGSVKACPAAVVPINTAAKQPTLKLDNGLFNNSPCRPRPPPRRARCQSSHSWHPRQFITINPPPLEALTIFVKTMETKGFFSIWNRHKCLS